MRLGWDDDTLNAPMLARRAEDAGVKMVTVHGRTRCQFYQGKADWRGHRARQGCRVDPGRRQWRRLEPGRGAREILAQSGADAVMIGRGALWRAVAGRHDRRGSRRRYRRDVPQAPERWPTMSSRTTRTCWRSTASRAACARRASILAGISTAMRRHQRRASARRIMTSLDPARGHRS